MCIFCVFLIFLVFLGIFGAFVLVFVDFVVFPQCSPIVVVFLRVVFRLWWLFLVVFVVFVCV